MKLEDLKEIYYLISCIEEIIKSGDGHQHFKTEGALRTYRSAVADEIVGTISLINYRKLQQELRDRLKDEGRITQETQQTTPRPVQLRKIRKPSTPRPLRPGERRGRCTFRRVQRQGNLHAHMNLT